MTTRLFIHTGVCDLTLFCEPDHTIEGGPGHSDCRQWVEFIISPTSAENQVLSPWSENEERKSLVQTFREPFLPLGVGFVHRTAFSVPKQQSPQGIPLRVRTNRIFFPRRLCEGVGAVNVCKYLLESPKKMALPLGKAEPKSLTP